jgi:hypothetical protein
LTCAGSGPPTAMSDQGHVDLVPAAGARQHRLVLAGRGELGHPELAVGEQPRVPAAVGLVVPAVRDVLVEELVAGVVADIDHQVPALPGPDGGVLGPDAPQVGVLARHPVRVHGVDLQDPAGAAVVHGREVGAPAVVLGVVVPVLLGRQGGAPGGDPAGAVGQRPVGVVRHRRPHVRVARVADPGPGQLDARAGGGDPPGIAAVALELPRAVAPADDPDDGPADRVLLQLDLAGRLGLGVAFPWMKNGSGYSWLTQSSPSWWPRPSTRGK